MKGWRPTEVQKEMIAMSAIKMAVANGDHSPWTQINSLLVISSVSYLEDMRDIRNVVRSEIRAGRTPWPNNSA